jgi:hypothetical protein
MRRSWFSALMILGILRLGTALLSIERTSAALKTSHQNEHEVKGPPVPFYRHSCGQGLLDYGKAPILDPASWRGGTEWP